MTNTLVIYAFGEISKDELYGAIGIYFGDGDSRNIAKRVSSSNPKEYSVNEAINILSIEEHKGSVEIMTNAIDLPNISSRKNIKIIHIKPGEDMGSIISQIITNNYL